MPPARRARAAAAPRLLAGALAALAALGGPRGGGGAAPALAAPAAAAPAGRARAARGARGARLAAAALPRPGPFLLFEDLKERRPPRRAKRRRGKLWVYEDGTWQRLRPDVDPEQAGAETEPAGDARGLAQQLGESKEARRLLAFLENAVPCAAFGAEHVALSLHQLAVQRCTLNASALGALRDRPVLGALAARGRDLLVGEGAEQLNAGLAAQALRALALYRLEAPQLHTLIAPLASLVAKEAAEMSPKQVAWVVSAAADLRALEPELPDRLLPLLADRALLLRARTYLQRRGREDLSMLEGGLLKLRREVAFLRQVLPA